MIHLVPWLPKGKYGISNKPEFTLNILFIEYVLAQCFSSRKFLKFEVYLSIY